MTQEQKAEVYSKAVEKAKQEYNTTTSEDRKQWLEELFPELKESEDERVRKEILDYIDKATGCKRWVAWLEKQGEQKSFDYDNANIPQKDSTWSEEDKHWMQKVIDFMNHPDLIKATPTLAKDTINWLKSLEERVIPKQKHEWSEEDEKMVAKYLYEKKGYPIDVNGNLLSFDETMKDAEKYLKYKQDKFIKKASRWLKDCLDNGMWIANDVGCAEKDVIIEHFQNYMKGE